MAKAEEKKEDDKRYDLLDFIGTMVHGLTSGSLDLRDPTDPELGPRSIEGIEPILRTTSQGSGPDLKVEIVNELKRHLAYPHEIDGLEDLITQVGTNTLVVDETDPDVERFRHQFTANYAIYATWLNSHMEELVRERSAKAKQQGVPLFIQNAHEKHLYLEHVLKRYGDKGKKTELQLRWLGDIIINPSKRRYWLEKQTNMMAYVLDPSVCGQGIFGGIWRMKTVESIKEKIAKDLVNIWSDWKRSDRKYLEKLLEDYIVSDRLAPGQRVTSVDKLTGIKDVMGTWVLTDEARDSGINQPRYSIKPVLVHLRRANVNSSLLEHLLPYNEPSIRRKLSGSKFKALGYEKCYILVDDQSTMLEHGGPNSPKKVPMTGTLDLFISLISDLIDKAVGPDADSFYQSARQRKANQAKTLELQLHKILDSSMETPLGMTMSDQYKSIKVDPSSNLENLMIDRYDFIEQTQRFMLRELGLEDKHIASLEKGIYKVDPRTLNRIKNDKTIFSEHLLAQLMGIYEVLGAQIMDLKWEERYDMDASPPFDLSDPNADRLDVHAKMKSFEALCELVTDVYRAPKIRKKTKSKQWDCQEGLNTSMQAAKKGYERLQKMETVAERINSFGSRFQKYIEDQQQEPLHKTVEYSLTLLQKQDKYGTSQLRRHAQFQGSEQKRMIELRLYNAELAFWNYQILLDRMLQVECAGVETRLISQVVNYGDKLLVEKDMILDLALTEKAVTEDTKNRSGESADQYMGRRNRAMNYLPDRRLMMKER
ncbi:MAG: hypothetical protein ABIC95_02745 [archaeon]